MRRFRSPIVLAAVLAAAAASAQAPRITPAGDPSVKDDTIYKLVVNPKDYSDQRFVYLLDDGVVRFEADGSGSRTFRQVLQILTPEGAEAWGEQQFAYSKDREKLTINWVRVLDSTGKVISSKPVHEQESMAPVAMEAPVYSDEMIHRVSLGGVAPGTIVDYSYTVETLKPLIPGDWYTFWSVLTGLQTQRSRFILDLPTSVNPRIVERHLTFKRQETEVKGRRRVYVWATQNLKKTEREPYAPDSSYGQWLSVAAPLTWSDVSHWYAGLAKGRYELDPAIEKRASEIVASAKTRDDTLSSTYRWVAQDFRYVSLSLGIGGYQPHPPEMVFADKYGDCKDKATFFVAVARNMGFQAYPVLLSASGGIDTMVPSAHQFDHMIAAVAKPAGGFQFMDLTAEIVPYGDLPPDRGEFGLLVKDDGTPNSVIFPESPASANRTVTTVVGELTVNGGFNGKWTLTATGNSQFALREKMAGTTKPDSAARARTTLAVANSVVEGSTGDSLQLFEGRDLTAVPRFSVVIHGGKMFTDAGGTIILELPIENFAEPRSVATLEARGPRKAPISSTRVWGPEEAVYELRLTLPVGWRAKLPANIQTKGIFGEYEANYSQVGRELRVRRRQSGTTGVFPPSAISQLLEFLREMSKDDVKVIVLDR